MKAYASLLALAGLVISPPAFALGASDPLEAWAAATPEERIAYMKDFARASAPSESEPRLADLRFLINCVSLHAREGGKTALVGEVSRACRSLLTKTPP
jgi:hypothetical protein